MIDSHQHFWQPARGDYGWLTPELKPLYRDFLPDDLVPLLQRCGIAQTILVQAAPTVAETLFMLELAKTNPFIAGVVGWVDFESPDAVFEIHQLMKSPSLVGLRPMVQDIPDDQWLVRPAHERVFEAMSQRHLVFDALVLPRHLKALLTIVDRHPDLAVVIDHAAKPPLRGEIPASWFEDIAALSSHANVSCKVSGLVTEAAEHWTPADLAPVIDHLLATFGPKRLLWGSDWPVLNLASDYQTWFETASQLFSPLLPADRDAIFGGNAERIYLSPLDPPHYA